MNPSQKEVESTIQASELEIICVSVLASGVLDLTSAIQYLENLNVKDFLLLLAVQLRSTLKILKILKFINFIN